MPRPKNTDRLKTMLLMRAEGATYQEIASKLGLSYQYVKQEIERCLLGTIREPIKVIYPALSRWMQENEITVNYLAEHLCIAKLTVRKRLSGYSDFTVQDIKSLMKITGLSFEELTRTEDET